MSTGRFRYFESAIRKGQVLQLFSDLLLISLVIALTGRLLDAPVTVLTEYAYPVVLVFLLYLSGRYTGEYSLALSPRVARVLVALVLGALLIYPMMRGFDSSRLRYLVVFNLALFPMLILSAWIIRRWVCRKASVRYRLWFSPGKEHLSRMRDIEKRMTVLGVSVAWERIDEPGFGAAADPDAPVVNLYDMSGTSDADKERLIRRKISGESVHGFPDYYAEIAGKVPLPLVTIDWILENISSTVDVNLRNRTQRLVDLVVGCVLAVLALPVMAIIALLVKLYDGGDVLFVQERLGRFKRPFRLYKFRSMRSDAERSGPVWATRNDDRATPIGKVLRITHLDELPQLFNLIRGDITLVGPRPIRKHFAELMEKEVPYYNLRFLVKPGLTGWAQIKGPYGSNTQEQVEKFELDLYYMQRSSIFMNLYILFGTARHVTVQAGYE